jgi:hypothetical protein
MKQHWLGNAANAMDSLLAGGADVHGCDTVPNRTGTVSQPCHAAAPGEAFPRAELDPVDIGLSFQPH